MTFTEADTLTPFEAYMLADDTPEYPMTFFFRLRFRGALQKSAFEAAFRDVVRRHPLLHATVLDARSSRPRWLIHSDRDPTVISHQLGEPLTSISPPHINIEREFGVKSWFATENQQSEIWFQFHHACCDATAAIELLDELFTRYRFGPTTPVDTGAAATEVGRVLGRRKYAPHPSGAGISLPHRLLRTVKFFRNRPRALPTSIEPSRTDYQFPSSLVEELARPDSISTHRGRAFGAEKGSATGLPDSDSGQDACLNYEVPLSHRSRASHQATVNDQLLASVFSGLGAWCRDRGGRPNDCLRVAVPINLRDTAQRDATCANCVSMVFIDRSLQATESLPQLLPDITREMAQIKKRQLSRAMLGTLAVLSLHPSGMRRVLDVLDCATTTVLSNLGVIFEHAGSNNEFRRICLGDATLVSFDFLPPIRRGAIVTFGVATCGSKLSCCMHYDPRLLIRQHAIQLFDKVVQRMPFTQYDESGRVSCG